MAVLTPEQQNFVREAPQVSFELDAAHRNIISMMSNHTLQLQQLVWVQERDFAIASIASIEDEIQKRKNDGRRADFKK